MIDAFFQKLRARDDVSAEEEEALRRHFGPPRLFERGSCVVHAGEDVTYSLLLVEGFACRSKMMSDGNRQILEVNVPGDFVDLHGLLLQRLDHNIEAISDCSFSFVHHDHLRELSVAYPHLTRLLWLQTVIDAAIHRETVMSVTRRSALGRIAHFFIELEIRLGLVGMATPEGYDLPLTQLELGEVAGLTPVHINRTLKKLRELGLATFRRGRVVILDSQALHELAEFDPTYLSLHKRPR